MKTRTLTRDGRTINDLRKIKRAGGKGAPKGWRSKERKIERKRANNPV